MKFLSSDLGHLARGCAVRFDLAGHAANTMLLDDLNLARYRRGERFEFVGGHATSSPVVLRTPRSDRWHGVVDLGGSAGSVNASISVVGG